MGSSFEIEGFEQLQRRLLELGKQGDKAESKAISAGAEVVRQKISEEAPKSANSRQPEPKTQLWRTGQHAADHISASKVKKKDGIKLVEVGISEADNSEYFYLKFFEFGSEKLPPQPFMERSVRLSKDQARQVIKEELRKELGL